MPMCARCLGVAAGQMIGVGMAFLGAAASSFVVVASGVALWLCFQDWALQEMFGLASNNARRVSLGALGGIGTIVVAWDVGMLMLQHVMRLI